MRGMTSITGTPGASSLPLNDTEAHIELTEAYAAHNHHPAPGGAVGRRGRVGDRRRGAPLPRLPGRLQRPELRPSHPRLVARAREQLGRLTRRPPNDCAAPVGVSIRRG